MLLVRLLVACAAGSPEMVRCSLSCCASRCAAVYLDDQMSGWLIEGNRARSRSRRGRLETRARVGTVRVGLGRARLAAPSIICIHNLAASPLPFPASPSTRSTHPNPPSSPPQNMKSPGPRRGWECAGFVDCTVGMFIGGGRDNVVRGCRFERCATALHLDARGHSWESADTNCTAPQPCKPGQCTCNPASAEWLAHASPATARHWPQMLNFSHLTLPAFSRVESNTYCGCGRFLDQSLDTAREWHVHVAGNQNDTACGVAGEQPKAPRVRRERG